MGDIARTWSAIGEHHRALEQFEKVLGNLKIFFKQLCKSITRFQNLKIKTYPAIVIDFDQYV